MHRVLSWKRLLIVVGVLAVLAAAGYAVHHVQVRRQASALLDQARRAEAEGDPEKAIELAGLYLKFRPNDEEAAIWYLDLVFAQAFSASDDTEPLGERLASDPTWAGLTAARTDHVVEVEAAVWATGRGTRSLGFVLDTVEETLASH